jgi:hypothetical protein
MNDNLSDTEIEILLFGKWRFETAWEKISMIFKDDMTYEQTKIQTFSLYKPKELITGNKFNGTWYVNDRILYLNLQTIPKSFLNIEIPLLPKVYLADIIASLSSLFQSEKYAVVEINSTKFTIKNINESIIGIKIK